MEQLAINNVIGNVNSMVACLSLVSCSNRGELDLVKWDGSEIENRTYDGLGRLTNVDRSGSVVDEVRGYDSLNRLTSIGNGVVGTASYAYDENNNKLSETWDSASPMAQHSFTTLPTAADSDAPLGYDAEDRFRYFSQGPSSNYTTDYAIVRNHIGVIKSTHDRLGAAGLVDRSHSPTYETDFIGAESQTYDDDGQLTVHHSGTTLGWDAAGRMTNAVVNNNQQGTVGAHSYGYDGDGKRVWKSVDNNGMLEKTVYVYAGPNCIAEYAVGATANNPTQEYVYGRTIDSLLMLVRNTASGLEKLAVTRNQQWSVTALVDAAGAVVERYTYGLFGDRTVLDTNGNALANNVSDYGNPYGYTSRRHDDETGLMYFRARYYDSAVGEFISRDPWGFVDGFSVYAAVFTVNKVDPTGSASCNTITQDCTNPVDVRVAGTGDSRDPLDPLFDPNAPNPGVLDPSSVGADPTFRNFWSIIRKQLTQKDCISVLRIQGHGGNGGILLDFWGGYDRPTETYTSDFESPNAGSITINNLRYWAKQTSKRFCFCKPCKIIFNNCYAATIRDPATGIGLPRIVSSITGCTVCAPRGCLLGQINPNLPFDATVHDKPGSDGRPISPGVVCANPGTFPGPELPNPRPVK